MKNRSILKTSFLLAAVSACLLAGCSKNDGGTDNPNLIYVSNYDVPTSRLTSNVNATPVGNFPQTTISSQFPVRVTREVTGDATVNMGVDNSKVDAYNAANKTSYLPMPAGALTINNPVLHIKAGEMRSSDSLKVAMGDIDILQAGKSYLAPITVLSATGGLQTSSNFGTVYVIITMNQTNCMPAPTVTSMTGLTLVTARTGWTATVTSLPAYTGSTAVLFDGATMTAAGRISITPITSFSTTIDMGAVYTGMTGLLIYTYNASATYRWNGATISTSSNGTDFVSQGDATMSTVAGEQYVKFYSPVSARYVKINNVKLSSTYLYMAEFWIYQ